MPCEDLSKLCAICRRLIFPLTTPIAREYIPVNSLRVPQNTLPVRFDVELPYIFGFDTRIAGEVIGRQLAMKLEKKHYLTTPGKETIRRFHMWIRQTTLAEKAKADAARRPMVIVSVLFDLDATAVSANAANPDSLATFARSLPTTFHDLRRRPVFELDVGEWEMKTMDEGGASDHHASEFRLRWFIDLHAAQPGCEPYMIWSNFPPIAYGEKRPAADGAVKPWFVWREVHPTTATGKPAGAG
ncbi:hypothetical protein BJX64DRAFT_294290 [Aspergillus heterothallicus]